MFALTKLLDSGWCTQYPIFRHIRPMDIVIQTQAWSTDRPSSASLIHILNLMLLVWIACT